MRTYTLNDDAGRPHAFEVSSLLGRRVACRVAAKLPGAVVVSSNLRAERFCEFELNGERYAIEEPFNDNSRFWVGPHEYARSRSLAAVEAHFAASRVGTWAVRWGALLCCLLVAIPLYPYVRRLFSTSPCVETSVSHSTGKCGKVSRGA